jgi:hypothetical protein
MPQHEDKLNGVLSTAERIGVIGSPSSTTKLAMDILGSAVNKKLVGELATFSFNQEGRQNYALGQITDVSLRNIWHEDPTMRSLIRQRGQVNPISEKQDTHLGEMTISAVFQSNGVDSYEPSLLGTIPATGTNITLVTDAVLETLLEKQQDEIFYLGNVYGSKPKLPTWFKHFGSGKGGAGEAYHVGIFGKTGSGKSVLSKMVILGYARHKDMGIFILDPQGEFSKGLQEGRSTSGMADILSAELLNGIGRPYKVYSLENIALSRFSLLSQFLVEFLFFFELGIKSADYQRIVADDVEDYCRNDGNIRLSSLNTDALSKILDHLMTTIPKIYAQPQGIQRVQAVIAEAKEAIAEGKDNRVIRIWNQVVQMFTHSGARKGPKDIINEVINATGSRPLISIDLSKKPTNIQQFVWDEKIKPLIIENFLSDLVQSAELAYRDDRNLNTLVVMDEGHRLAPRGKLENEKREKIRSTLVDAVRTTRKYGLGWLFISQTLSSLDKEIIEQLRINCFGFGLSMGTEFQALRELAGGDQAALKLYQTFKDPHSAFDERTRQYSFMTIGPVSPLSFSGSPLFLSAFTETDSFIESNRLKGANNG